LKKNFLYIFLLGTALSLLFFILSFFLPHLLSSNYYRRSLKQLKGTESSIKREFSRVLEKIDSSRKIISESHHPETSEDIFELFKHLHLDTEIEGVSYCSKMGEPVLWMGNVVNLNGIDRLEGKSFPFEEQPSSLLIRNRASVYLVQLYRAHSGEYFVLYHLVAFLPQFKTPYLKEYHFLKQKLLQNCNIEYWDFREDVSGLERTFSRHQDEYIGEPGLQGEVQTLIFPLRNQQNDIIATVNLSAPSLSSRISGQKEQILLVAYVLLGISLVFLLIYLFKAPHFKKEKKMSALLFIILTLAGLRMLFFFLGKLEKFRHLSIFSPSSAGFLSVWDFTRSPADIFLTSFFLFSIAGCIILYAHNFSPSEKRKSSRLFSLFMNIFSTFVSLALLYFFQEALAHLVFHSNLNLLRFSFKPSFILLHLSIFFLFLTFVLISLKIFQIAAAYSSHFITPLIVLAAGFSVYVILLRNTIHPFVFFIQGFLLFVLLLFACFPEFSRKKEAVFSSFLLVTFLFYSSFYLYYSQKSRLITQNFLQNIIESQEAWGDYLVNQSLPEIDKRTEAITSFFQNPEPSDLAGTLWEETLMAKFNWYSSLELLSPDGAILSRFSLNVPELFQIEFDLPENRDWSISRYSLPFMGIEKDFLIGYKDIFSGEDHIGRIIIYLLVDYDTLPFLYSANPYFELLRISSIPSLDQFDLGFAIFNIDGELLFNPNKISKGIPFSTLQEIQSSSKSVWSSFSEKGKKFESLYFKTNNKIYSLFLPVMSFLGHSTGFLRLFFLYLFFSAIFAFLLTAFFKRKNIKNPFWSFSNRVYISFIFIALFPLLLFTLSTRNFVERMFADQITERAEVHATLARRVVEDYLILQQEEQLSLTLPPDNMMLVISSTISNDVNLYQDGLLISSSRREFFDYGILPEMIDGEVYYKILYENNPFYSQTQKIGDYSFHTLTVPYAFQDQDSLLLISLPFPLEQQEITKATRELLEFFFLISSFFVFIVLILARGVGSMIVTPIRKLLAGTREVSLGNLEVSIPHQHEDEMKTLIDGFNAMVESLKKHQQDMAEMSKKVAWAEMARKVAHEIKNPLTPIQLSAEHLLRVYHEKPADFKKALDESTSYIIEEVENLRRIAKEFLEISRETTLQKEIFDFKEIIRETISPYKKVLSERIRLEESYRGEAFAIRGDKDKIKIALRNIFTNAIEAIKEKGKIEINLSRERQGLRIEIMDSGSGMDKEVVERIFEPYFSTKEVGTGLGLSIAKKIVEDHKGKIEASSQKGLGTKITLFLPFDD
jgi:signal transduction histidine kinase